MIQTLAFYCSARITSKYFFTLQSNKKLMSTSWMVVVTPENIDTPSDVNVEIHRNKRDAINAAADLIEEHVHDTYDRLVGDATEIGEDDVDSIIDEHVADLEETLSTHLDGWIIFIRKAT